MPIEDRLTDVTGVPALPGLAHAVTVTGRLAFVSGQVAMDDSGTLIGPDDVAAQARQVFTNLGRILDGLGAGWADVVRFGFYLVGSDGLQAVREVRDEFLAGAPEPASSLVRVAGLFRPGLLVEADAVVALP